MKISSYIHILAALLISVSCLDLESDDSTRIPDTDFPKDENDAEALITGAAYGPFRGYWGALFTAGEDGWHVVGDMCTDVLCCKWTNDNWIPLNKVNFTAETEACTRIYKNHIQEISTMTLAYDRIADVPMPDHVRTRMHAELHCGQGLLAYFLFDMYDGLQIADLETLKNPLNNTIVPRKSHDETVKYIEDNLRLALESGALADSYRGGDAGYGRYTNALCHMTLLKLYMHEKRWEEAEIEARELMNPKYGFNLVPEYKDIFTLENEGNEEIIWAITCDRTSSINTQMWLSQVLPSVYPTTNPSITKWDGYRVPWEFYDTFDPSIEMNGRRKDRRLEVLVGEFTGTDGVLYNKGNPGTALEGGALPVKIGEDPNQNGENGSSVDWVVFRYADVLLSLSEIIVRQDGAVNQEARDLLNRVRTRANISEIKSSDYASADEFLDLILLERGHELWGEGFRRQDLIRYGKFVDYARIYNESETVQDYMVLFPLPTSVIVEGRGKVLNNPGY